MLVLIWWQNGSQKPTADRNHRTANNPRWTGFVCLFVWISGAAWHVIWHVIRSIGKKDASCWLRYSAYCTRNDLGTLVADHCVRTTQGIQIYLSTSKLRTSPPCRRFPYSNWLNQRIPNVWLLIFDCHDQLTPTDLWRKSNLLTHLWKVSSLWSCVRTVWRDTANYVFFSFFFLIIRYYFIVIILRACM